MSETQDRSVGLGRPGPAPSIHEFPPFRLDVLNEQLWRDDTLISLRPKTFAVLRYLVERPRQLVRKQELLAELWGDANVEEGILKTSLREIRRALGDSVRAPRFIETAHGRGYRFIGSTDAGTQPSHGGSSLGPENLATVAKLGSETANFVGRRAELELLQSKLAKVLRGERQVVLISGEPGIGKTTLLDVFVESLERCGPTLWIGRGQCIDQYGAGEPYLPILEALGRLSAPGSLPAALGQRLIDVLERHAPSWLSQLPALHPQPGAVKEHSTRAVAPERMLREMAQALEALTEIAPCVLLLEDLHWADYSTLDLLSYLTQRSGPAALLIIGSYRPGEVLGSGERRRTTLRDLCGRSRCQELLLSHLNERSTTEYLERRFPDHGFTAELSALLRTRTSGNPLFMLRVVDAWLEQGLLRQRNGQWQLSAKLDELSGVVPESVNGMIELEYDRLTAFEQTVLEAASVAGAEFSTAAVAAALDADLVHVEDVCTRLARRGQFLRPGVASEWPDGTLQVRCRFIHALYHQVFYERTGASRRGRLHQKIGEREERGHAHLAPTISAELAMHFERGRDYPRAVRYSRIAGEHAIARSAYREAIDHLTRALELLEQLPDVPELRAIELELLIALGTARSTVQGYSAAEVERVYARARELCQIIGDTSRLCPVLVGLTQFYLVRAEYGVAREIAQQLLKLSRDRPDPDAHTQANFLLGTVHLYSAEFSEALARTQQASEPVPTGHDSPNALAYQQDPGVAARSIASLAWWMTGYPDRAVEVAEDAVARAERLANPFTRAFALYFSALIHRLRGENQICLERASAAGTLSAEHGFRYFLVMARIQQGTVMVDRGEVETGLALVSRGWAEYQATGARVAEPYFHLLLAQAHAASENVQAALDLLEHALVASERSQERLWEPELYRLRGELLRQAGPGPTQAPCQPARIQQRPASGSALDLPASPEACFLEALRLAEQRGSRMLELRAGMSWVRCCTPGPERERACVRLRDVLREFTEGHQTSDLLEAKRLLREQTECRSFGQAP